MALEQRLFGDLLPGGVTQSVLSPEIALFQRSVLDPLLEALGKRQDFRERKIRCPICESRVTWKNLRVVAPRNGVADFICDGIVCYDSYLIQLRDTHPAAKL